MLPGDREFAAGVAWERSQQRIGRLEERLAILEARVRKLLKDLERWTTWGRRLALLLALWVPLLVAGLNQDQASSLIAAVLKSMLR